MTDTPIHQVIIIGGGTAGHTAAIYTARAGLAPDRVRGSVTAGGALYTTTDVENFPGFPEASKARELIDAMRKQAERFGAELHHRRHHRHGPHRRDQDAHRLRRAVHRASAVILATGSGYRKLGIPGEDQLSGRGVSCCATCDGFFFGKDLVVVGGGDTAMEEATFLTRFAEAVTVVHRRDPLRASKIMQDRALADPKISFELDSEPANSSATPGQRHHSARHRHRRTCAP